MLRTGIFSASVFALFAVGCSGNSAAIRVSFQSAALAVGEGGTVQVTVRLGLTGLEDPLPEAVSVQVTDLGTGTATAGSDYTAFNNLTFNFAAGTANGASETLTITTLNDASVEGSETINLQLVNPSGAALASPASAVVSIADNQNPAELVTELDVGLGFEPIASGTTVDFGGRVGGAPAGTPVLLRVTNPGDESLAIEAPLFTAGDTVDFAVDVDDDIQPEPPAELPAPSVTLAAGVRVVADDAGLGMALEIDPVFIEQLAGLQRVRVEGFPIQELGEVALELERLPSPWASDSVLTVGGEPVAGGAAALLSDLSLWTGHIDGWPASSLYLGVSSHGTRGWMQADEEDGRLLHVLAEVDPLAVRLAWENELEPLMSPSPVPACGGVRQVPGRPLVGTPSGPLQPSAAGADPLVLGRSVPASCRVLFETDNAFFELFRGTPPQADNVVATNATIYVTQLVGAISDLYEQHVQTQIVIASLGLHEDVNDPWVAPDQSQPTLDDLLTEFADKRGPLPSNVAVGHFLSAVTYVDAAGLAFFDTLCDSDFSFSVSGFIDATFSAGNFDGQPAVSNFDMTTVAHEIAHNFGAAHTDEYCPQLDRCVANDQCFGGAICGEGTIMSNCHTCPGGELNIDPRFHPFVANEMRLRVNGSCVGTSLLEAGQAMVFSLNFTPIADSGPGPKSTDIEISHSAVGSPFTLELTGESN